MGKIKVSELFYSLQGEGRYQGVPSIFLRTFGCNLTCSGFGMPKGMLSEERNNINPKNYTDYKSLPLVSTGCDSYASWDPRFKHLSPVVDTSDLADRIISLLPYNDWQGVHLVITGGEPLLGWQREYPSLLDDHRMKKLKEITFETNGTHCLTDDFKHYLKNIWTKSGTAKNREVTFSVSPKLSCSGENENDTLKPDVILDYQETGHTYLKFVVATQDDVNEALYFTDVYRRTGFTGEVYLMPVGGVDSVYSLNNKNVAELAMKYGLRFSDRLQVVLWKNQWGT
jgi:7-carboxy-7-deazaguanine synthase